MAFPFLFLGNETLLALRCLAPGPAVLRMCLVLNFPAYFLGLYSAWCRSGTEQIANYVQGSLSSPDDTIAPSQFTRLLDTGELGRYPQERL